MKKTILFLAMAILLVSIANAEVLVSQNSFLNINSKTFVRANYVLYPESEHNWNQDFVVTLNCEDIGLWNTNNPLYTVKNVSLITQRIKRVFANFTYEYVSQDIDFGCYLSYSSPTCDVDSTPILEKKIYYIFGNALQNGESVSFFLTTYFNGTNIVDDSPCNFGLVLTSQNCRGCDALSFEETVNALDTKSTEQTNRKGVYSLLNAGVDMNYSIWIFTSYIIKIVVFIAVILGIIYVILWLYYYLKNNFGRK